MNILVLSHEYPPIGGGGANACMFLASEYAKQGHRVIILTVWYPGEKEYLCIEQKSAEKGNMSGKIEIYRVKSKRRYQDHCSFVEMFDYLVKTFPLAKKICKETIIDICQVFFGVPSGPIGLYLKIKYKIPYIIRFGGGDIPGAQPRFRFIYKLLSPMIKCIWINAKDLVANSANLKKEAQAFWPNVEVDIIYNGIDTARFVPSNINLSTIEPSNGPIDKYGDTITLLFVSRLIEGKGLQYLIPELDNIQKDIKKKLKLVIVGDGPYKTELQKLAQTVKTQVCFEGFKDKAELLEYYQGSDVFVFPSRREGMPNVVLEAMACGLPIVMNNCGGSTELVESINIDSIIGNSDQKTINRENKSNGIISNGQDNFVDCLKKYLLLSEDEQNNMGINSRRRACELFSWENSAQQYLTLFNNGKSSSHDKY